MMMKWLGISPSSLAYNPYIVFTNRLPNLSGCPTLPGLQRLTGGSLLLRNKYFIVLYRGKDFLPPSVAATVKERMELTKSFEDAEEKARSGVIEADASAEHAQVAAGTLAEYYQAQARWGREVLPEEYVKMRQESFRSCVTIIVGVALVRVLSEKEQKRRVLS